MTQDPGPPLCDYCEKKAAETTHPPRHQVKLTILNGGWPACQVEIDGKPIVGLQSVVFSIDMQRRPLLTLTLNPQKITVESDTPVVIVDEKISHVHCRPAVDAHVNSDRRW